MGYISSTHNEGMTNDGSCNNRYKAYHKCVYSVYKCNKVHKIIQNT